MDLRYWGIDRVPRATRAESLLPRPPLPAAHRSVPYCHDARSPSPHDRHPRPQRTAASQHRSLRHKPPTRMQSKNCSASELAPTAMITLRRHSQRVSRSSGFSIADTSAQPPIRPEPQRLPNSRCQAAERARSPGCAPLGHPIGLPLALESRPSALRHSGNKRCAQSNMSHAHLPQARARAEDETGPAVGTLRRHLIEPCLIAALHVTALARVEAAGEPEWEYLQCLQVGP